MKNSISTCKSLLDRSVLYATWYMREHTHDADIPEECFRNGKIV